MLRMGDSRMGLRLRSLVALALLLAVPAMIAPVLAAPPAQPLLRSGSCPSGYYSSGKYCVPGSSARFAIDRNGACPSGYYSSGNYCVASSDNSGAAIHRSGSCPGGYYASGKYCVESK